MNILLTVWFFIFISLLGRAAYNIFFKKIIYSDTISDIKIKYFYPLFSLFFLGNLIIFLNFFFPIKEFTMPILIFSFLLIIYDLFTNRVKINFDLELIFTYIVTPSLLGVSSYGVWLSWDTGLYHIPHQLIIRENSIIFGLTNLNLWFGWSSIIEYISSILWLENNFILLRILEIVFFCFLFNLLFYFFYQKQNLFYRNISLAVVAYAFLDNFGYLGGGNGFVSILSVGKFDGTLGILFFVLSIMILNALLKEEYEQHTLVFLMLFSLFAVQVKQTGAYLIFLLIPYLYKFITNNKESTLNVLKLNIFSIFIFLTWIIKNLITTSCLFFPARITCVSFLPWYEEVQLDYLEETMIYSPISLNSPLSINEQFNTWFNFSKNSQFFINFPISLLILISLFIIFFQYKQPKKNLFTNSIFIAFIVLNTVFWYLSNFGNVRYGFGLWMLLISFIAFKYRDSIFKVEKLKIINYLFLIVFIGSVAQVPRGYSYESLIELKLQPYYLPIEYGATYLPSKYGWGVIPKVTSENPQCGDEPDKPNCNVQCWDVPDCKVEDKNVEPSEYYFGYTIYYPDGVTGN